MKTILFVDDESNILSGFKRSLRKKRGQWLMLFAEGGALALDIINDQHIDVLVTDMQMPGMSGDQLLEQVINISPSTARIVLTGHADLSKLARASELAHRFLSKPCSSEELIETVEELLFSQQVVSNERVRELMGKIGKLPSLPNVYFEVSAAIDSKDASADQIASIIKKDGAMSAKVLQLANSPIFFGSRQVSSIQQAITRFGMSQLKQLILQCSLFKCFEATAGAPDFMDTSFWKYSRAVAELSKQISLAEGQHADRPDEAYIAGLMHEIGYLILVSYAPDIFEHLCNLNADADDSSVAAEHRVFEVAHNEAGAYLLSLWNIPAQVVEAVYYHHQPCMSDCRDMNAVAAVHAAAAIICSYEEAGWPFKTSLDMKYLEEVGVAEKLDGWRELADPIMEKFEQWLE
ncbi:MAG: HDOD domain-containing protein [Pseudomonadales bacterium]|nr:HDOD domain-containing protein [Pseudomonadales bacterium]